jgi:hypothetical protein
MQGFNNFVSYPMDAGQAVNAYLAEIANNNFGSDWLSRQQGEISDDRAIQEWWKEASAMGEQAYVKQHTVAANDEGDPQISFELLLLAEEKYPALLPDFYETLLKSSCSSWPVAEALVRCDTVPRPRKLQLLQAGIATHHREHRNYALDSLQKLDPALADAQLLTLLKQAPNTAADEFWTDHDANLGREVSRSHDPKVWRALDSLLDRADLGMRMELIHHLSPPRDAPAEILRSFHDIFLRYRADETIRDNSTSEKFSGPGAGYPHDRIAMRDFIYLHWSRWLDLKLPSPDRGATADAWKAFRDAVGQAIEKQFAEPGKDAAPQQKPES